MHQQEVGNIGYNTMTVLFRVDLKCKAKPTQTYFYSGFSLKIKFRFETFQDFFFVSHYFDLKHLNDVFLQMKCHQIIIIIVLNFQRLFTFHIYTTLKIETLKSRVNCWKFSKFSKKCKLYTVKLFDQQVQHITVRLRCIQM